MDALLQHWPFIVAALILAMLGQVTKTTVFTVNNVLKYKPGLLGEVLWWGRKTLPLHPVVVGIAIGLVPGMPVSPGVPAVKAAIVLYFAGAGICSTWFFAVIKGVLKKQGIELGDDADSDPS